MARMFPQNLADEVTSQAEKDLFQAFQTDLDDDYLVFHQVNWQVLDGNRRPQDGEADFIIAHPERGIIVLEAKGGRIQCDPRSGRWTSQARNGVVHGIKNPFQQARHSKYALLDALRMMLPAKYINLIDAVAMPDVVVGSKLPGLDKPRAIILDQTDLLNVSGWVGGCLAYARGTARIKDRAPGQEVMEALFALLGQAFEFKPALWGEFRREREDLIRLTEQQYILLNALNLRRRVLISGCAGSGKTMLAIEKAWRLEKQQFRVLFTCYNKSLASYLREAVKPSDRLHILHFHELCDQLAIEAKTKPKVPEPGDDEGWSQFFERGLPEAALEAIDLLEDVQYDAIIVDEAQDFLSDWWLPLQMLLKEPDEGLLYIFYDDNQSLYDRENVFPIEDEPYPLSVNCRNTQSIHTQVARFYQNSDSLPTVDGPAGRPLEIVELEDDNDFYPTLQQIIKRLIDEEKVPHDEIVVLSPIRGRSKLWIERDSAEVDEVALVNQRPLAGLNQVLATTIHDYKGLESSVVILVEVERWPVYYGDLEPLLYVACSRAKHHLIVMLPHDASDRVRKLFC